MTVKPDLEFRALEKDEVDLAIGLASVALPDSADTESFGIDPTGELLNKGGVPWGLFMRDILSAAAWFETTGAGEARVLAIAIPRRRWGMGLAAWMLTRLAESVPGRMVKVEIKTTGRHIVDALEESGFTGPDALADGYPAGVWTSTP